MTVPTADFPASSGVMPTQATLETDIHWLITGVAFYNMVARFEYWTGSSTPPGAPLASTSQSFDSGGFTADPHHFVKTITGLTPGTQYWFRLRMAQTGPSPTWSPAGAQYSPVGTFTTGSIGNPTVQTDAASAVTHNAAVLNGTVDPKFNANVYAKFQGWIGNAGAEPATPWESAPVYMGDGSTVQHPLVSGVNVPVLVPSSLYTYRCVIFRQGAGNAWTPTPKLGSTVSFTTSAAPGVPSNPIARGFSFVLTDLVGNSLGRIENAYERHIEVRRNGMEQIRVRMPLDDPSAWDVTQREGKCLLKVYDDLTLIAVFDVLIVEESGPGQAGVGGASVTITAFGPLWRLTKRLLGQIPAGQTLYGGPLQQVFEALLFQANQVYLPSGTRKGETGIRMSADVDNLYPIDGWGQDYSYKAIAEILTETQAAKVPYPVGVDAYTDGYDTFTHPSWPSQDVPLTGHITDLGDHAWETAGDIGAGPYGFVSINRDEGRVVINAANDTGRGRWSSLLHYPGFAPVICDEVIVGIDLGNNTGSGVSVPYPFASHGLYARATGDAADMYTNSCGYIRGGVQYQGNVPILFLSMKLPGGPDTVLATREFPMQVGNLAYYSLRLAVDKNGNASLWGWYAASGFPSAVAPLTASIPEAATGGVLESGGIGWQDHNSSASTWYRIYEHFYYHDGFGAPQSFDFAFDPIEPTIEVPSVLPRIANLRIKGQIGSFRQNAVFTYGDGDHSSKAYSHIINREGTVNDAWAASETDFQRTEDEASELEQGIMQELIPNDLRNAGLRKALADAHVFYRKQPRHLLTFEPSVTAPRWRIDYNVGDLVIARVRVNGRERFPGDQIRTRYGLSPTQDLVCRVYGVDIDIDVNGVARYTPILTPEGS